MFDEQLAAGRQEAGFGTVVPSIRDGPEDVPLPDEVSLPLRPDQLLVRSTRIFHGTRINNSTASRLMSHW